MNIILENKPFVWLFTYSTCTTTYARFRVTKNRSINNLLIRSGGLDVIYNESTLGVLFLRCTNVTLPYNIRLVMQLSVS